MVDSINFSMLKKGIFYGGLLTIAFLLLKLLEGLAFSNPLNLKFIVSLIAFLFFGLGILLSRNWKSKEFEITKNSSYPNLKEQSILSSREQEVLQAMANGMSNKEIAKHLFLSENTIKTHASNLYFKLDVKRRTQAIQRAREMALI